MADTTSTQEKIVYKDHDILISVHTMQQEMLRRMDEDRRDAQSHRSEMSTEMKTIAIEQTRIATEFTSVKDDQSDLAHRVEKLENKSVQMDIISYVLGTVAGLIAWFK